MPVPDYQEFMLPLLNLLSDGHARTRQERNEWLADYFGLTAAEREELIPSGRLTVLYSRSDWAGFYLLKAGLVHRPKRGALQISEMGRAALDDASRGMAINTAYLRRFPAFEAFQGRGREATEKHQKTVVGAEDLEPASLTPFEAMEAGYQALRSALASELLDRIKTGSPRFFEQLVLDLLVAMGYGGSRTDAAQAVGGSGDGGVDGYIKEDKLGLDSIYLQAKRWEDQVGSRTVREFAGSLEGHRARKGVLITTSKFTRDALDYVGRIDKRIVLVDGDQLANLMIDHGVGVTDVVVYPVKRIDEDYFEES